MTLDLVLYGTWAMLLIAVGATAYLWRCLRDQKAENAKLKEAMESVPKASHNFVVDMIVELRRPLNGIIGMLQMIDARKYLPSDREGIGLIEFCSQHMLSLLERIQYYSENQAGVAVQKQESIHVRDLLRSVSQKYIEAMKAKSLEFSMVIEDNVPVKAMLDPQMLTIILENLLDNSVKFTNQGSIRIKVECDDQQQNRLVFSVKDSGLGIAQKTQSEIFEAFGRSHSDIPWYDRGTGLGLSLVKNLVEKLGGEVWLDSEVGFGSTFWFSIVLSEPQHEAPVEKQASPTANLLVKDVQFPTTKSASPTRITVPVAEPLSDAKILMVDDEYVARKVLSSLLDRMGYPHDVAVNGQDAIDKISRKEYSLVFMDIQMPLMDGWEAAKRILSRQSEQRPKIVALTSHARMKDKEMSESVGMDLFLTKPIRIQDLKNALEKFAAHIPKVTNQETLANGGKIIPLAGGVVSKKRKIEEDIDPDEPLLDLVVLKEYYDDDMVRCMDIVERTLSSMFDQVDRLRSAVQKSSHDEIMAICHEMKGAVNLIRCNQALRIIENIEASCERNPEVEPIKMMLESQVDDLKIIVGRIEETVKNKELIAYA